ncbi:unnamed protein product [Pseudo-nitzschia multistriata]|uniref:BZIP domain-containing protein n=1 Tax=Pseudo-nitzschia multistriata TaxID=183589 RepID=A0A448Z9R8_9STRA|nr:unnamed protein product [Pseudo-nitzschia multistriata]
MLQTESGSEHSSVDATEVKTTKAKVSQEIKGTTKMNSSNTTATSSSKSLEWEEVKKARNRINSQRTRERERSQIKNLEAERARLWLSNDAIKFQNRHFREIIGQIVKINEMKRLRASGSASSSSALFGAAALGGGIPMSMRQDMMGGHGGGLDGDLFQSSRISASATKLTKLSDADLLARRKVNALEMQKMMRQQQAIERLGVGGGVGMGGFNMALNGRMGGGSAGGMGVSSGMSINGINLNAQYSDVPDNLRIRQLMLQHSNASGDIEPKRLLSSIGNTDAFSSNNGLGGNIGEDSRNTNGNGISLGAAIGGIGGIGDLGGISDAEILQMSKRQKFGF